MKIFIKRLFTMLINTYLCELCHLIKKRRIMFLLDHYLNSTGLVSTSLNVLGPGSDIEKYIFAALVVP